MIIWLKLQARKRKQLKECNTAVLFDANDRDDMFLKINEVLSDEALYGRLKSNASLDEKYLLDNVRPTLLAILDRDYRKDDIQKKERVHL